MILLAVAAQSLDMLTYTMPGVLELNPAVLALGIWAIPAKLALVGFLVFLGVKLGQDWRVRVALCLATASGVVGACANVGLLRA